MKKELLSITAWFKVAAMSLLINFIPSSVFSQETNNSSERYKWEFIPDSELPLISTSNSNSSLVVLADLQASGTQLSLYYAEGINEPFEIMEVLIDGKTIAICPPGDCLPVTINNGNATMSRLDINRDQIDKMVRGTKITLVMLYKGQPTQIHRQLLGFKEAWDELDDAITFYKKQNVKASIAPTGWDIKVETHPTLGRTVLTQGLTKDGKIEIAWSSVAYWQGFHNFSNASGAVFRLTPMVGIPTTLNNAYWKLSHGNQPLGGMSLCGFNTAKCIHEGKIYILLSEADLVLLQIGRPLQIEWTNASNQRVRTEIILGQECARFVTKVQDIKGTASTVI